MGGLLTSTCLTFFVVPIMYTLLIKDGPDTDLDIESELADEPAAAPVLAGAGGPAVHLPSTNGVEHAVAGIK